MNLFNFWEPYQGLSVLTPCYLCNSFRIMDQMINERKRDKNNIKIFKKWKSSLCLLGAAGAQQTTVGQKKQHPNALHSSARLFYMCVHCLQYVSQGRPILS